MISRGTIEQAYCFLHQKWTVYAGKSSERQRDDIEYAVSSYADSMSAELYDALSGGNREFLKDHSTFREDMVRALERLSDSMESEQV